MAAHPPTTPGESCGRCRYPRPAGAEVCPECGGTDWPLLRPPPVVGRCFIAAVVPQVVISGLVYALFHGDYQVQHPVGEAVIMVFGFPLSLVTLAVTLAVSQVRAAIPAGVGNSLVGVGVGFVTAVVATVAGVLIYRHT